MSPPLREELTPGTQLLSVEIGEPGEIVRLGSHPNAAKSLTVVGVTGQMAMVPWVRCESNNGQVTMFNLALAYSVTLVPESE